MRFTSSARRTVAALLCLLFPAGAGPPAATAGEPPSPSLILTFCAADIPEATARDRMEKVTGLLPAQLHVTLVPLPPQADRRASGPEPREIDAASLERISATLADAARRIERMETREATRLLDDAERDARSFRPADSLRPYLAELFLRRGLLLLWAGNRTGAEEMFGRVRIMRPEFTPDPGLYSPAFREAWSRAAARPAAGADILVETIPAGADIFVNGARAGSTPGRVRVPVLAAVGIRVARPGYLPVERVGHWYPGDSEMIEVALTRDRMSRLEELLAAPGGGKEAGALLAGMASAAGAERVGILVLTGGGPAARVRVLSLSRGDGEPADVGEFRWPGGTDATGAAATQAAALLKSAGWPAVSRDARRTASWYHKWWIWVLVGAAVAGAAAGVGGGGGGSGGSTGAIGVNF